MFRFRLLAILLACLSVSAAGFDGTLMAAAAPSDRSFDSPTTSVGRKGNEFFEKSVRPLLVKHCYECHSDGRKQKKGGLQLDLRAGWEQGGDSGPAIVPGKPDESLLISSVRYESFEMPPKGKLSAAEIAILEKWVAMGAPDPRDGKLTATAESLDVASGREFWSFQSPQKHSAPATQNKSWAKSEIDRFLLAKLEAEQLSPVADADRREWLRRVTFDLTGLPPTVSEIDAFLNDSSAIAKANVIDRLLASTQFGEQWGRHWLDLARYADSNGGDINLTYYNAWRYRDYVVNALNEDKPFDQFAREQLAGDLLPADSVEQAAEQLTATGFLIIGPKMLSERNKEKLHMDVVDEQLDTIGRVFLGLTLGCARCHDHKFDPIPAQDYYAMAGILRSTETVFGIRMNNVNVSGWLERAMPLPEDVEQQIANANSQIEKLDTELKQRRDELKTIEKNTTPKVSELAGIVVDDSQAELVGVWTSSTFTKRFVGDGYIHDNREDRGQKSVTFRPEIPADGDYEVRIAYASGGGRAKNVPVVVRSADDEKSFIVNQEQLPELAGLFHSLGRFQFTQGHTGYVRISNSSTDGYVIADAAQFIPVEQLDPSKPDGKLASVTTERVTELSQQIKSLEARQKEIRDSVPAQPMVMAARDREKTGDTTFRVRGLPDQHGEVVPRGFLSLASFDGQPEPDASTSGRAELVEWLTDSRNPLIARVIVNRVWMHLMGEGIVRSVDNFGTLGDAPTHPELLDTLAVEFVESGWSIKQLVRRICLTRAYGLSTALEEQAAATDPENQFWWRQNRRRLTAEEIRDAMLAVSNRLNLEGGGSSVADFGEQAVNNASGARYDKRDAATDRRSLYLPIVRNDLPAMLTVFDFADPDMVTGKRAVTNVPAQALLMLNSPFVAGCAESMAEELETTLPDASPADRINWLYLKMLGRPATPEEVALATEFVAAISAPTADGQSESEPSKSTAAWKQLIHSIFASSEFRMLN
ncbi:DUF1553 domain-containing protein [bacterium]|nr:DUF1553 domain-containing protein [bacterium]